MFTQSESTLIFYLVFEKKSKIVNDIEVIPFQSLISEQETFQLIYVALKIRQFIEFYYYFYIITS